ncbi:MAG: respiratory nitrate reductase subunit gamma [Anaeromyxobacteraceae bacterium]
MNGFLFGTVPYVLFAVAVVGGLRRFGAARETVTTHSSQLLEARLQYWGAVSWHYGILLVLLVHLCAIFLPGHLAWLLSAPARLLVIELSGFALGLTALAGLLVLVARRFVLRGRTPWLDWTVLALLLLQVGSGLWIAVTARWGLAWFTRAATPWLASLLTLSPRVDLVENLPLAFKLHALNALVLVALVPFTRLAHALVVPAHYVWRLPQVVVWRRPRPTAGGAR